MRILTASVRDLDEDRISAEAFQSLRVIWQITVDAVREKHAMLEGVGAAARDAPLSNRFI